jgi:hypothetical protein
MLDHVRGLFRRPGRNKHFMDVMSALTGPESA